MITSNFEEMPDKVKQYRGQLEGRSMLVKSLRVLPIESIVRGYITGMMIIDSSRESQTVSVALVQVGRD